MFISSSLQFQFARTSIYYLVSQVKSVLTVSVINAWYFLLPVDKSIYAFLHLSQIRLKTKLQLFVKHLFQTRSNSTHFLL